MDSPVLEVAQTYIEGLKPGADTNWLGYCPLHGEVAGKSKPSFSFNVATGQWYCFAEGRGGSLRMLLKELGRPRTSIDTTMDRLDRYLVKVARKKSPVGRTGLFRAKYPLPERILGLFESCPEDLVNAGFDEEILWRHDIGWDSEREWITFPIRDLDGQLAGISGRTNDPAMKYKVYRQELRDMGFPGYDIANHDYVWRWDQVYPQVYAADGRPTIYVCEGFKAALWMVQHGYENTVALMGTAMSDTQKVFLERLGGTVIWCLDNDKFGRVATRKNGYKLRGVSQFVMNYPANTKQPDDLASDGLKNAIDTSLRYSRWCARRRKESHYG